MRISDWSSDVCSSDLRMALRIEESEDDGRRLKGIFARVANAKGQVLSISAREGAFLATSDSPDTIILRLSDGTIVQDTGDKSPRVQIGRAACRERMWQYV